MVQAVPKRRSPVRFPSVALGLACMVTGVWGGLARIGWELPGATPAELAALHGPLMVIGFLGTVVSLERAVALGRGWGYLAPACLLAGTALILFGAPLLVGHLLALAGALVLTSLLVLVLRIQPNVANAALVLAALLLSAGVLLWAAEQPLVRVVPWWAGFLVVTILGERLELAAMGRLTPRGIRIFAAVTCVLLVGLILLAAGAEQLGIRIAAASLFAYALWLLHYDVARFTVRRRGLPRFVALALLPGYLWLGIAGVLWLRWGALLGGGIRDAQLHAVFIGFVFSMIFGHAPVIFPGVLGVKIPFRRWFYGHLVLLHAGLAMRVVGDLAEWAGLARWGAMVSAAAILLFLLATATSAGIAAHVRRRRRRLR